MYRPSLVSEREPGGYEDCTWASAVMLNNAHHGWQDRPATRAEYEALRVAGGDGPAEKPGDGSNQQQAELGILRRYEWDAVRYGVPGTQRDFGYVWDRLLPGIGASLQGYMGAFPAGSHWRRWDPGFHGAHCVYVQRESAADRVWWMDPLAPHTYTGEWMEKNDLRRFVSQMAGGYLLAPVAHPGHFHKGNASAVRSTPFPDHTKARYDNVNIRSAPNLRAGNVVSHLDAGENFTAWQYVTGTSVEGSTRWLANHSGTRFVHSKNLIYVGGAS